jgi:hypothetical protein
MGFARKNHSFSKQKKQTIFVLAGLGLYLILTGFMYSSLKKVSLDSQHLELVQKCFEKTESPLCLNGRD